MGVNTLPKLNFSVPFAMTSALPLDWNSYFTSLTEAQAAAATADVAGSSTTAFYYGQQIMVVEGGVATLYVIQPDKTLKAAGSALTADGTSIAIVDGQVQILGFAAAETGAQPRKKADGSIEWIKPDTTTVEGLQTAVEGLESDVESLQTAVGNVYTKSEVDSKVAGVYRYKGSVATYAELPSADVAAGDVYNVAAADAEHGIKAGDNVAWTGTAWDVLAGTVDLSGYATAAALDGKVDKVTGSRLMTEAEGTKLSGIAEGAQVNAIDGVSSEFVINPDGKTLSLAAVAMDKVTGLSAALAGKVDAEAGKGLSANDYTTAEKDKLAGIAAGAQQNVIEAIQANGVSLPVSEKTVNLPLATAEAVGLVKSSIAENGVSVAADGAMTVNSLNVSKLTQTAGDLLILDGGDASGLAAVV